jgi:two-component system sensor histidine kinase DesK
MRAFNRWIRLPWVPPAMGKGPYLWTLFLLFFLWKYVYVRPAPAELLCLAATLLVFLPLYFASFWTRNRARLPFIAAMLAMAALWAPVNHGAGTLVIYAAAMCAGIDERRAAFATLGIVMAVALLLAWHWQLPPDFILPALVVGAPVGVAGILETRLRQAREGLLRKQEEVEHMATIAERERISRDLHDLLGHTLSLITLKAELAGKLLERDPAACRREIADIERSARQALGEVRSAVSGYRQTGFRHELDAARAALQAAGVTLAVKADDVALPAAVENVLALALREAVTNIVRHAGASRCDVGLSRRGGHVVLSVRDDGAMQGAVRRGNGLAGMQERAAALGGHLALRAERGLVLEISIPFSPFTRKAHS